MDLNAALLHDFELELPMTKTLLGAIPDDKLDWKPHEKSMSLGQLAGHLAETPSWTGAMMEDEMDFADMGDYAPYVPASSAEAVAKLEENAQVFREAVTDRDDTFMRGSWRMRAGDKVLMEQPRHEVIRQTILHHTAHHRGQLTVYLRLLDLPVPMTYGSTADQSMF